MQKQSSLWKTVLAAPGPDVVVTWVTPQRCHVAGGLFCCGRYHETNFSVNRFQECRQECRAIRLSWLLKKAKSFAGRGFSRDIDDLSSSGVLTPDGCGLTWSSPG